MKRRHCWLRLKRHRFVTTSAVSLVPRGFAVVCGGELLRCRECGWETTSSTGEQR